MTRNCILNFLGPMLLTAWQGRVHEASELIQAAVQMATGSGRGMLAGFSAYASAVLDNGLGLYDGVRDAAKPAFERDHLGFATGHPDSRAYPLATCTVPLVDATPALPARR